MSANESTPAVSLREARRREADAEEVMYYYPWPGNREKHAAARRATDEALVRAVLRVCGDIGSDPSAVLDAVEREETER